MGSIIKILPCDRKHLFEACSPPPAPPPVANKGISHSKRNKWLFVVATPFKIIRCCQNICNCGFQGKGWKGALAPVSPGGNICQGFLVIEHTPMPGGRAGSCLLGIYSGVFWQELIVQPEPNEKEALDALLRAIVPFEGWNAQNHHFKCKFLCD